MILIGNSVENPGTIRAPKGTATLVIGNRVLLTTVGGPAGAYIAPDPSAVDSATQNGRIGAAALKAAGGNFYTLAGNKSGLISATGTQRSTAKSGCLHRTARVVTAGTQYSPQQ